MAGESIQFDYAVNIKRLCWPFIWLALKVTFVCLVGFYRLLKTDSRLLWDLYGCDPLANHVLGSTYKRLNASPTDLTVDKLALAQKCLVTLF